MVKVKGISTVEGTPLIFTKLPKPTETKPFEYKLPTSFQLKNPAGPTLFSFCEIAKLTTPPLCTAKT
jgi:hypothetical protein